MFYYIFSNTISKQLSTLLSWFESKKLYCLTGAVRKKASKNEQKNTYFFWAGPIAQVCRIMITLRQWLNNNTHNASCWTTTDVYIFHNVKVRTK